MPIIIESNYSKKIGLPGYSSHSYSLTVKTELSDLSQLERESAKLYSLLQGSVDREIQEVGFIPDGNGHGSPTSRTPHDHSRGDHWNSSVKQRDLILKIVEEHKLDKQEIESLAKDRFNLPVKSLNRLQASGLIEELLATYGPKKTNGNSNRSYQGGRR